MAKENIFNDDERQYLQMMQGNIERMANNSANCKTWLVTIVAGFLAIGCGVEQLNGWIILTVIPVIIFWYLDGLYLSLERGMRNRQRDFLNKASAIGENYNKALYNFTPLMVPKDNVDEGFKSTRHIAFSRSVTPLYVCLLIIIVLVVFVLNRAKPLQTRELKCTTDCVDKSKCRLQGKGDVILPSRWGMQSKDASYETCRICTCKQNNKK
jgi:hypothetical protein